MPLMTWDDSLSVNIKRIDEQHKRLVNQINLLHEAMSSGKTREVLGPILEELVNYAVYHFGTEEELMVKYNFPGYEEHLKEHMDFKEKAGDLLSRYKTSTIIISIEILNFLRDWVTNHVTGTDKKYQEFLNTNGEF